jgi:Uma2 family endonuclease
MTLMGVDLIRRSSAIAPPELGPYRRRDYDQLPEQPRYELLFGRLVVNPSPTSWHQVVSAPLERFFERTVKSSGGMTAHAPLDVILADHSIVQPDILYVTAARLSIVRAHVEGAPDLVVEIISPSTARRDEGVKKLLYAVSGVQEYWLAYWQERRLEFLVNEGGRFVEVPHVAGLYRSPKLPEIRFDVARYWRQVDAQLLRLPGSR